MEMIILRHNVKDPYGICGIKYFLSKSGIPIKENINKKARIDILYGNGIEKNSDFAIQINNKAAGKDAFELSFIINKKDDMISIDTDIFSLSGKILSGELEKYFPGMGIKEKKDKVSSPILDRAGKLLTDCLISASRELDIPLIQKSFWPEGKKFAVCLTHDIDEIRKTYQWITYPVRFARKMDFNRVYYQFISFLDKIKGREPYWTFGELMDIESKRNVRSTFFFLNERGKVRILDKRTWRHAGRRYDFNDSKVSGIIRELNNKGWDVGLHGSFYSYDDCNSLIMEKKLLENVFKSRVYGIRQHNLNLRIPETWLYQEKTGFEYDTTLGFNDCIGFRWGTCFPFRPFYAQENRSMDIIEIPLIIEDTAFLRSDNPWEEYARISKEVEDCEG
ncbi:MAG TPA: polysaccharide deacetylase family protein, partial [Candidatus Methanoperedens sp.]